jgi:hypothetical protein
MEVHHHAHDPAAPHHHKKNWKNYFWEFFMLFLAVLCGFIAEVQFEHYVEHQREKQYIISLIEDLKNDTSDLDYDIKEWQQVVNNIDTLQIQIDLPINSRNTSLMYKAMANINYNNTFLYHDRTIAQLKHSGNFRIIRNKKIANAIIDYDAIVNTAIKDIEHAFTNNTADLVVLPEVKLFHSKFFSLAQTVAQVDSIRAKNPQLELVKHHNEEDFFTLYNGLQFYKGNTMTRIYYLNRTREKALAIVKDIQEQYSLE